MSFAPDFTGQTVVVSGAAIGFGRVIAESFQRLGARVHGCDVRVEDLRDLGRGTGIETEVVDLTDRQAGGRWIAAIEQQTGGPIHVLINNAGGVSGQSFTPIESVTDAAWDQVLEINLGAALSLCRASVPGMKAAGGGAIVNITSGAALKASLTGVQAYCAAKHALLGLTRQLAHELGPFGVRVNSVAPGFVQTNEATARQWASYSPDRQRQIVEGIALRRLGTPQDIANAAVFLASSQASFISGEILSVNGGH
ncbi:SDR family NAD(P)-dependent oxidoreductase [Phenylobacterium sp.]|uniref:SDR family NAD(P)-dependent oxidoreductase n=1 Tax=Phenylobacterium sp. TaxID=1871053 RepID=UPI002FC6B18A